MSEQYAQPIDQEQQVLLDGAQIASETIALLAETGGSEAVHNYFGAVLADTEGVYGVQERHAVVALLGHEQQAESYRAILSAGHTMIDHIVATNESTNQDLAESANRVDITLDSINQQRSEMASSIGQHGVTFMAEQFAIDTTSVLPNSTQPYVDSLQGWLNEQRDTAEDFGRVTFDERSRGFATQDALKTTLPEYEGGAKNLTEYFDETTPVAVAEKVAALMGSVSSSEEFQAVIASAILDTPDLRHNAALTDLLEDLAVDASVKVTKQAYDAFAVIDDSNFAVRNTIVSTCGTIAYAANPAEVSQMLEDQRNMLDTYTEQIRINLRSNVPSMISGLSERALIVRSQLPDRE